MNNEEKIAINGLLVVKLQGPKSAVIQFLIELKKIIPQEKMNMSPILKNEADNNVHCYVNIMSYQPTIQNIVAEESTDVRANQG